MIFKVKSIPSQDELQDFEKEVNWIIPESDEGISYGRAQDGCRGDWVYHHQYKFFNYSKQYRVAVQAGGCLGLYPYVLAKKFAVVYTFEPTPVSFHCLVNNCQLENVFKFQAALGDHCGTTSLEVPQTHVGGTKVRDDVQGYIPILTLDSLNLSDVDLIVLDCEEYEDRVLAGAINTINRWKPVITMENATNGNKKQIWEGLGYREIDHSVSDTILVPNEWTKAD